MAGDHLDPAEEDALRRHYGVGVDLGQTRMSTPAPTEAAPPPGAGTRRPTRFRAGDGPAGGRADGPRYYARPTAAMTRSEERLRVGDRAGRDDAGCAWSSTW